jgi:UDP-2-acetamido-3-amino-2,3-dideoxy-glucuronate N-acetyltransferase
MRRLALIGGGYWGKNLARNFLQLNALHSIVDPSDAALQSYGADYDSIVKCRSYDEVLANPEISSVAIAAPAILHYEMAQKALRAGKHVYVEKPLSLAVTEGRELIALAQSRGLILMVGHLLQYHPCVEKLREMVTAGELGRLFYITSNRLNLGKIRSEENALWSFAPHDISVILGLAGSLPETVQCTGEHYLTRGVADTTLTQMTFPGGLKAHVYVSWMNPFKEQKLTVVGSAGMAVFDDTVPWSEKLVVFRDYLTWQNGQTPVAKKSAGQSVAVPEAEPLRAECLHFLQCCESRQAPRTDGHEGLRVLQVLEAAQHSMERSGERIKISESSVQFFAHPSSIVDAGAKIGAGSKIWHFSHVSDGAELGPNCNLGQNVFIAGNVSVGANVKIQNNVSIYAGTAIEDNVFLGPSCVLTNISNPRSEVVRKSIYEKTLIKRGATIGANATVVCGTTIGQYAFVAAGAVVTKDVADYAVVKGSPARQTGWMSRHGQVLKFDDAGGAVCPESKLHYVLVTDPATNLPSVSCLDLEESASLPASLAVGSKSFREFRNASHS